MSADLTAAQEMLAALREKFLDDLPARLNDIERLVLSLDEEGGADEAEEAGPEVYRKIHSLKGSAGTYGAMILTNVCHQLEDYLARFDTNTLTHEQTNVALRYVGLLRTALSQVRAGWDTFPDVEAELHALRQIAFEAPQSALVVLASRSVTKVVLAALAPLKLQSVVVGDGMSALQRLLHERFDLLVTGLNVPELSGAAVIGAVRLSGGLNAGIRTVVVTSVGAKVELPSIAQPDLVVAVDPQLSQLGTKVAALLQADADGA